MIGHNPKRARWPKQAQTEYVEVHVMREKLANWMIEHGFATGHGDTIDDLLDTLSVYIRRHQDDARNRRLFVK